MFSGGRSDIQRNLSRVFRLFVVLPCGAVYGTNRSGLTRPDHFRRRLGFRRERVIPGCEPLDASRIVGVVGLCSFVDPRGFAIGF